MIRLQTMLQALYRALFPYRSHLEDEIVYLRAMLARSDRRIEELEGRITPIPQPRRPAPKLPTLKQPVDWATFKQMSREEKTEAITVHGVQLPREDEQPVQA